MNRIRFVCSLLLCVSHVCVEDISSSLVGQCWLLFSITYTYMRILLRFKHFFYWTIQKKNNNVTLGNNKKRLNLNKKWIKINYNLIWRIQYTHNGYKNINSNVYSIIIYYDIACASKKNICVVKRCVNGLCKFWRCKQFPENIRKCRTFKTT